MSDLRAGRHRPFLQISLGIPILVCGVASAGVSDIDSFRIEKVPLRQPEDDWARESTDETYESWLNVLKLEGTETGVPLIPTVSWQCTTDWGAYRDYYGLREDSLRIVWLRRGELIWISWTDWPSGSGCWNTDGHVILRVTDSGPLELYRDHFRSFVRNGWRGSYASRLDARYEQETSELILTTAHSRFEADKERRMLLGRRTILSQYSPPVMCYVRRVGLTNIRRYRAQSDRLEYLGGQQVADLGEHEYDVADVARFFGISTGELRRMNTSLGTEEECSGAILLREHIEDLAPQTYEQADSVVGVPGPDRSVWPPCPD